MSNNRQYLDSDDFENELDDDFELEVDDDFELEVDDKNDEDHEIPIDKSEVIEDVPEQGIKDGIGDVDLGEIDEFFGMNTAQIDISKPETSTNNNDDAVKNEKKNEIKKDASIKFKEVINKIDVEKFKHLISPALKILFILLILAIFTTAFLFFFSDKKSEPIKNENDNEVVSEDSSNTSEEVKETESIVSESENQSTTENDEIIQMVKNPIYQVVNFGENFLSKNVELNQKSLMLYEEFKKALLDNAGYLNELKEIVAEKEDIYFSLKDQTVKALFVDNNALGYYNSVLSTIETTLIQDQGIIDVLSTHQERVKVTEIMDISNKNETEYLVQSQIELIYYLNNNNVKYSQSETTPKFYGYYIKLKDIEYNIEEFLNQ